MADNGRRRISPRDLWAIEWAARGHPDKPPSRGAVAGWIWAKARATGTHACAGVPWLAAVSGVSERTVKRVVSTLKTEGWVSVRERGHYRGGKAPPTATVYDLAIPATSTGHTDDLLSRDPNMPSGRPVETGAQQANFGAQQATQDGPPLPSNEGMGAAAVPGGNGGAQRQVNNRRRSASRTKGATEHLHMIHGVLQHVDNCKCGRESREP